MKLTLVVFALAIVSVLAKSHVDTSVNAVAGVKSSSSGVRTIQKGIVGSADSICPSGYCDDCKEVIGFLVEYGCEDTVCDCLDLVIEACPEMAELAPVCAVVLGLGCEFIMEELKDEGSTAICTSLGCCQPYNNLFETAGTREDKFLPLFDFETASESSEQGPYADLSQGPYNDISQGPYGGLDFEFGSDSANLYGGLSDGIDFEGQFSPYAGIQDGFPYANIQDGTPYAGIQDAIPFAGMQDETPYANIQDGTPYAGMQDGIPFAGMEDNTPYANIQDGTPYASIQDGTPYAGMQDGTPFAGMEDSTPYANIQDGTPYAGIQDGTPYASIQDGTPFAGMEDNTPYASIQDGTPYAGIQDGTPYAGIQDGTPYAGIQDGTPYANIQRGPYANIQRGPYAKVQQSVYTVAHSTKRTRSSIKSRASHLGMGSLHYDAFLSAIAYCPSESIHDWNCASCKRFSAVSAFEYSPIAFMFESESELSGFVGVYSGKSGIRGVSISFASPQPVSTMSADLLSLLSTPDCDGCHVSKGVVKATRGIMSQVLGALKIVNAKPHDMASPSIRLVGHNFGGAVASFVAFRLRNLGYRVSSVTTFGAPRFCDATFASAFAHSNIQNIRVTSESDISPLLPHGRDFVHVGKEVRLKHGNSGAVVCDEVSNARQICRPFPTPTDKSASTHYFRLNIGSQTLC